MNTPIEHTTLAVIAGGAGSRMGGPKHSLRICGRPILVDLLERARWPGPTLLSLEHGPHMAVAGSEQFGTIVRDDQAEQGPLAAIGAALGGCRSECLLAIPVDMCVMGHEHLAWIVEESVRAGAMAAYLRRPASPDGIEPLPLFLRRAAMDGLARTLARGGRSIRSFFAEPGVVALRAPTHWADSVWTNVNTPEDLIRAERARGYTPPASAPRPGLPPEVHP